MRILIAAVSLSAAVAFSPTSAQRTVKTSALFAGRDRTSPAAAAAAAAMLGWALASQGCRAVAPPAMDSSSPSTVLVSLGATKPEPIYEKLDFSMPTYGASTASGFGSGTEAYLGQKNMALTDPGAGENDKQKESMRKAEEARKERLKKQKEEMKLRDEAAKAREAEKKREKAARFASIFE